jgi:segregation and condensation protein B
MTQLPIRVVEAALFSAGKPMLAEELAEATKLPLDDVKTALKELHKEYETRDSAIEVGRAGPKWSMQIRTMYAERTKGLAPMEIPQKVLRTLALIAFHQPIKQADLKDMVGSVVYEHVHELHDRGLIKARQDGITKILTTTERFQEYFGIEATEGEALKQELAKKVGLTLAPKAPAPATPPADDAPQASLEAPAPTSQAL